MNHAHARVVKNTKNVVDDKIVKTPIRFFISDWCFLMTYSECLDRKSVV